MVWNVTYLFFRKCCYWFKIGLDGVLELNASSCDIHWLSGCERFQVVYWTAKTKRVLQSMFLLSITLASFRLEQQVL